MSEFVVTPDVDALSSCTLYSRDGSAIMLAWQLHQTLVMGRYAHLRFGVESGYEPKPGTLFSADWHVYWELTRGTLKRASRLVRSHAYGDDAKVPADERTKYQLAFAEDAARQYLSEALPHATSTEIMQLACLCPGFFDQLVSVLGQAHAARVLRLIGSKSARLGADVLGLISVKDGGEDD